MNQSTLSVDLPRPRRVSAPFDTSIIYFFFVFLGLLGYASSLWMPPETTFAYLTLLMIAYLAFEVTRFSRSRSSRWLINPVILSSIFVFGLPFGVTNIIFYLPESYRVALLGQLWRDDFTWLNSAMLMALLAAFAMWRGYYFRLGGRIAATLKGSKPLAGVLRRQYEVRLPMMVVLVGVSLGSRLLMIRFGIFGYSSELDQLYETSKFSQFLQMGVSLGTVAFVALSLNYFSRAKNYGIAQILVVLLLVFETAFGAASGMKNQAILPLLTLGLCAYIARDRIPRWTLLCVPILLVFSFKVIEPLRYLRFNDPSYQNRSLSSIVEAIKFSASEEGSRYLQKENTSVALLITKRMNLTLVASLAIEFKDQGRLTEGDPRFLQYIFSSPAYAVVPRFLWPSKPYDDIGSWFNRVVIGGTRNSATGMSPVGYLYMAGGGIAIMVGFCLIGIWQRVLAEWLLLSGSGGHILLISQLKVFVMMPTAVYPILISAIRILPLVVITQWTIFKR